jgi:hypothetical protein
MNCLPRIPDVYSPHSPHRPCPLIFRALGVPSCGRLRTVVGAVGCGRSRRRQSSARKFMVCCEFIGLRAMRTVFPPYSWSQAAWPACEPATNARRASRVPNLTQDGQTHSTASAHSRLRQSIQALKFESPRALATVVVSCCGQGAKSPKTLPHHPGTRRSYPMTEPITRREQRPIWRCTHCGSTVFDREIEPRIRTCRSRADGVKCRGHYHYAAQDSDWQRCPNCAGTGYSISTGLCERCGGTGWLSARKGIPNPGLPPELWGVLHEGLWHATDVPGLIGIVVDGCIRLTEATRWPQSLCRQMGCISLFDFGPTAQDQEPSDVVWGDWFGARTSGRCPIWLRIDRMAVDADLMAPPAVQAAFWSELDQRKCDGKLEEPWGHLYIQGVEAGHRGPITASAIVGAAIIDRYDWTRFTYHQGLSGAAEAFERGLPPPPAHAVDRLRELFAARGLERAKGTQPDGESAWQS